MTDSPTYRQIGVIGAGRVARALALALAPHSAASPLLWARSAGSARTAVDQIGSAVASDRIEALVRASDLIAIAVSDDAIAPVVAEIAAFAPTGSAPFIFHVSGRSGAEILDPLHAAGAATAAIHPVMTFTGDPQNEVARMIGARFAITGSSADATAQARQVVRLLGGVAVEIREEHRPLYHAALCHAANHLVTLISGAAHALTRAGVDDPHALVAPLVRAALENSLEHGFGALSGPLLRGDGETIGNHLDALKRDCPELLPAYRAMARATLDQLERSGAPAPSSSLRTALSSKD
ncbi:Rossmann-like and DUF2520 domain-containing protein [Sphingopyxis witflariensis]|uniref:Cytoplasmic protein n=1 Tax=Sphingopyxis witflariensis TaxID=173675 RepID=A0A246K598_9SPHN|nr:Rossmann-like and DUF2520 domain-containing protein [Sphingopyxis witflariensis]OWR01189.1 cytoplasmic protein [Sphingopyxis witflariensis]